MKLDSDYILDHYIEIYKKIFCEPVVMPRLINQCIGNESNSLGYKLILLMEDVKIPPEVLEFKNRKREEIRHFEEDTLSNYNNTEAQRLINEYHEKELMKFLEDYPEFSGVILNNNLSKRFLSFLHK